MKMFYQLYIARNEAGDSTADLGKLLGITKTGYWQKERGVSPFKLAEAFILAQRYNMSVDELFPETLNIKKEVS